MKSVSPGKLKYRADDLAPGLADSGFDLWQVRRVEHYQGAPP